MLVPGWKLIGRKLFTLASGNHNLGWLSYVFWPPEGQYWADFRENDTSKLNTVQALPTPRGRW